MMHQCPAQVPVAVNLRRLFPSASFVGCGDIRTLFATDRSSECRPGATFAVLPGTRTHGRLHVGEAAARGARSLLVEHPLAEADLPQCVVRDVRRSFAELCTALAAHPARHLGLTGVTGTNGKTTITWLVRSILQTAGCQTGLLGTVEYHDGLHGEPSTLTTPDAAAFTRYLATMVRRGTTHAAVELSSHALDQRRVAGTLVDVAILSNITQDHFDYHCDLAAYRRSKLRIFDALKPAGLAVINLDDAGSRGCLADAPGRVRTYAIEHDADITGLILEESLRGTRFRVTAGGEEQICETRLIGRHNVSNCLAAIAAGLHFGLTLAQTASGIAAVAHVPGRMQPIECGQPFDVFVDYAHTPDALQRCVSFVRRLCAGRLICVFGAGGDRDRSKRALMGQAASVAEIAIVTSDNPRTEHPRQIIDEILTGFASCERPPLVEIDREQAIARAFELARPGDAVLIAGKGHETEQIIGQTRHAFDDREVSRRLLQAPLPHQHEPHHLRRAVRGRATGSASVFPPFDKN